MNPIVASRFTHPPSGFKKGRKFSIRCGSRMAVIIPAAAIERTNSICPSVKNTPTFPVSDAPR